MGDPVDPLRNYKKVLAGGNRDSDSDESSPLLSSSCTSSSSFGSVFNPSTVTSELELENETSHSPITPPLGKRHISPIGLKKELEKHLFYSSRFEPPTLKNYSSRIFRDRSYTELSRLYQNVPMTIQNSPFVLKSASPEEKFDSYMECQEPEKHTQSSLVTIFAIWNTTMGSSLLAMAWGIQMAGLLPGILINILIAGLCLYTCQLLLKVSEKHGMMSQDVEVSTLCQDLLGNWAAVLARVFSIVVLLGADIVYMVLMSNFLYNFVYFIYGSSVSSGDLLIENSTTLCPKEALLNMTLPGNITSIYHESEFSTFERVWDLYSTVPIILSVILFGVLNFKSPTFFTKFNSLGTISVMYLILFVAMKAWSWGINITDWNEVIYVKPSFTALSGMLSLSYFIHNIIISIMKNNRHPERNGRDLTIAFSLITFTYLFIGIVFYISFPYAKSCIEDNIFNNFTKRDTMTVIARVLLLFQLFTVFPLISFMLRKDILGNIQRMFDDKQWGEFSYGKVMFLNACLLVICVFFACFLPKIGTLIRYTGAMSGLVYIFMLPNLLKMASLKKERKLSTPRAIWHIALIATGAFNLLSQFFITD